MAWGSEKVFEGMVAYERGCSSGTHERAFVGDPNGDPIGVAWVPKGLPAVPKLDGNRSIELQGPGGKRLFFVPLSELGPALLAGAHQQGLDPDQNEQFRVLTSLEEGEEPAVHGLFSLIKRLCHGGAR